MHLAHVKRAVITSEAQLDILEQAAWYDDNSDNPDLAVAFDAAVKATIHQVLVNPLRGQRIGNGGHRAKQVEKPFDRFRIVYLDRPSALYVIAVWSAYRDPAVLFRRI